MYNMSMRNQYTFKPRLLPTLVTLILLPILLSLSFWQYSRMQEKQALLDTFTLGEAGPALAWDALATTPARYTKIAVSGKFLPKFSFLLEHQMYEGQQGYFIYTPLCITPGSPWLLINRGWVPRDEAPDDWLKLPESTVTLTGLTDTPSENRFILGENFLISETGLLAIQRMALADLSQYFQHPLYDFTLLLDAASPYGFVRDWHIKTLTPDKHLGYAVQWLMLALTLIILYILVNLQRKSSK